MDMIREVGLYLLGFGLWLVVLGVTLRLTRKLPTPDWIQYLLLPAVYFFLWLACVGLMLSYDIR